MLGITIPRMEKQIGVAIERIITERSYRGHDAPPEYHLEFYVSSSRRSITERIKHELRRRSAVEPIIAYLKAEHHMGRNPPPARTGDAQVTAHSVLLKLAPCRRNGIADHCLLSP